MESERECDQSMLQAELELAFLAFVPRLIWPLSFLTFVHLFWGHKLLDSFLDKHSGYYNEWKIQKSEQDWNWSTLQV